MTSLFKKLNLRDEISLTVLNHPPSFETFVRELNDKEMKVEKELNTSTTDWCLAFVTSKVEIEKLIEELEEKMQGDAQLWFAYPKKSSKNYTSDITRDSGWEALGAHDWEPVRQVAIDDDWSALRFRRVRYIKNITRRASMAMTDEAKRRTSNK